SCSTTLMSTMRTLTILTLLLSALPALAAEPSEHWRCGPYDVRIVPGGSYVPSESIVTSRSYPRSPPVRSLGDALDHHGHDARSRVDVLRLPARGAAMTSGPQLTNSLLRRA